MSLSVNGVPKYRSTEVPKYRVTVGRPGADLPAAADIERMQRAATIERCTSGSIGTVLY
jgi:hypothetical protein